MWAAGLRVQSLRDCPGMTGGVIRARSTAVTRMQRWQRCRPRRARAPQTTTAAAPAAPAFSQASSMVAALRPDLAAEYPVGPCGITQDQRYHDGNADQHQDLAVLRRGRLP